MKYKPAQQKEPLVTHDVPSLPWFKLGVDIFEHRSHHYMLVADYFSKFPVVKKLTNQTAEHVISLLKTIFAEYGVPATVYTDQGTQFETESDARYFRNRRHIRPAIEIQPQELSQVLLIPGTEPSHQDTDLSHIPAQQQLMSLTSHHQSHCPNNVCRKRPRSELRCLVHDELLDHLRD